MFFFFQPHMLFPKKKASTVVKKDRQTAHGNEESVRYDVVVGGEHA